MKTNIFMNKKQIRILSSLRTIIICFRYRPLLFAIINCYNFIINSNRFCILDSKDFKYSGDIEHIIIDNIINIIYKLNFIIKITHTKSHKHHLLFLKRIFRSNLSAFSKVHPNHINKLIGNLKALKT